MWMSLVSPSLETGFVYHFPGITVQRQRIKSEQSGSAGPPGAGIRTQLRWAHGRIDTFQCGCWAIKRFELAVVVKLLFSILGTGASILSPKRCLVRCTMAQKPRCRECCRAVDGPGPAPKLSGTHRHPISQSSVIMTHFLIWGRQEVLSCHFCLVKIKSPHPYFCTSDILRIIAWSYNHMNQWLCAVSSSYRTVIRPSFMVTYKQVTVLEWKCCPGFVGEECREGELLNCSVFSRCKFLKHCSGDCGYWN